MTTIFRRIGLAAAAILAFAGSTAGTTTAAKACSDEPYMGTVCIVAFNFCPRGYLEASGQLLSISQYTALYSLIGTIYGGDGRTSFGLPDLRGRVPLGLGQAQGGPDYHLGQRGGLREVTLTTQQLPSHTHSLNAPIDATAALNGTSAAADTTSPAGAMLAEARQPTYSTSPSGTVSMNGSSVAVSGTVTGDTGATGNGHAVPNMQPYLTMRYCIAVEGLYPPRN
jgi:microcystin-dependent protein